MKSLLVDAPGKLVLIGEYAVLEGYPAAVLAVDRRVRVRLDPAPIHLLSVAQLGVHDLAFRPGPEPLGPDPPAALRLVGHLLDREGARVSGRPPFRLELDSSELMLGPQGPKLGLGSSAALAAALTAALQEWGGSCAQGLPLLARVHELHREAQGQSGSGIDVAAAVLGGCLCYRMSHDGAPDPAPRPLAFPAELGWLAVWSGQPASTPELLHLLRALASDRPSLYLSCLDELGAISSEGIRAIEEGETSLFLAAAGAFREGLERLGRAAGVEIVSPAHRQIADIVRRAGGEYKPSGAGGGDLGLAFARSPEVLHEAAERLERDGFLSVSLALDPESLRIQRLPTD